MLKIDVNAAAYLCIMIVLPSLFFFFGCSTPKWKAEAEQAGLNVQLGTVLNVRERHLTPAHYASGKSVNAVYEADFLEITILLDSGQEVLARREADDFFKKGDRVR
ncbi:MAG: hypothetical protein LBD82_04785, partial [Deltaproteobacteria bacterium]|nr:hypothetical protein [Deltaproteobacteria bacterium]